MNFIRQIFNRKVLCGRGRREARPLRIDGARTVMTPQPDDAELAAQALLESMSEPKKGRHSKNNGQCSMVNGQCSMVNGQSPKQGTPEYYRQLSERIRTSRAAEARLTMRYLAYCEERLRVGDGTSGMQLALPKELYVGQIGEMEQELYKRQDVAEREGGELLRRWQHCLAEVIVRQMTAATAATEDTDG